MPFVEPFNEDKLFELTCIGAQRLAEFVDVIPLRALLDEDTSRLRDQAKVALSGLISYLILQSPRHHAPIGIVKELERWIQPGL